MDKETFIAKFPWIDPTMGYPSKDLRHGVRNVRAHIAIRVGAAHKTLPFMKAIKSTHLEETDGYEWELYSISYVGDINGTRYYWGMPVEGIGAFNCMIPAEFCRPLTEAEATAWSKQGLAMKGMFSGVTSYTLGSGVSPKVLAKLPE